MRATCRATKPDAVARLGLPGIGTIDEPLGLRVVPQGRVGSTLVGFTGVDNQGLAGVEFEFNELLKGQAGQGVEATDNDGRPIPFGRQIIKAPVVGDTVVLTIDRMLEYEAEEVLRETARAYHAEDASVIIMRAQTGEILALANYPNFDPSRFALSPESSWRDRAITDPYEPGSTFKVITAAAALDSGRVTTDDTFAARDQIEVGGRIIHNADDGMMASGHAYETVDDIVTYSHNVGAAEIALRTGESTMYEYIKRFGLDEPTGVDLPGESGGILGSPEDWYGSRLATIGFGQGVSVTALQLADAYCAVANGGLLMKPMIAREIVGPDGKVVEKFEPETMRRVIKPETSAALDDDSARRRQARHRHGCADFRLRVGGKDRHRTDGDRRAVRDSAPTPRHSPASSQRTSRNTSCSSSSTGRKAPVLWKRRGIAGIPESGRARFLARGRHATRGRRADRRPDGLANRASRSAGSTSHDRARERRKATIMASAMPMPLRQLLAGVGGELIGGNPDVSITSIAVDSRRVEPGALFVCLTGARDDGHLHAGRCGSGRRCGSARRASAGAAAAATLFRRSRHARRTFTRSPPSSSATRPMR